MKRFLYTIILCVVSLIGISIWWHVNIQPIDPKDSRPHIFLIRKGDHIRDIVTNLKQQGYIHDTIVFFLLIKKLGIEGKIQAGDFYLSHAMSAPQIADTLTHGTLDIWVTIPEGKRATEIVALLSQQFPTITSSHESDFVAQEGYLFPDTYLFPKQAETDLVISTMTKNFENKFQSILTKEEQQYYQQHSQEKRKLVIIASIIEREAQFSQDRPLVASVLFNRLQDGMKLQIDPPLQYALGYQLQEKTWWKKSLFFTDLAFDSPYNTYLYAGLPPGPIANPGILSIQAALHPASSPYFFYLSDKTGKLHFARTHEEHNAFIKKYL